MLSLALRRTSAHIIAMQDSSAFPVLRLDFRSVLAVEGEEATAFLERLITQKVDGQGAGDLRHGALLTPQGKIITDMMVFGTEAGFILDVPAEAAESLLKRLTMFKLRAKVTLTARPDLAIVQGAETALPSVRADILVGATDPRDAKLGYRAVMPQAAALAFPTDRVAYDNARLIACVPECGIDYPFEDSFPADVNLDELHGVDFKKGCFVGQEVVSRMKRKATARRRTMRLVPEHGLDALAPGPVLANAFEIGRTTATGLPKFGRLALIRVDRLLEAEREFATLTALDGSGAQEPVKPVWPDWLRTEWQDAEQA
jgi:folate-binding protein YgfZ